MRRAPAHHRLPVTTEKMNSVRCYVESRAASTSQGIDALLKLEPFYMSFFGWAPLALSSLVPAYVSIAALAVILSPWLLRLIKHHRLSVRTPLDFLWAAFLTGALVGLAISVDPRAGMEQVAGMVGGVGLYYAIVNNKDRQYLKVYLLLILVMPVPVALWGIRQARLDSFDATQLIWVVEALHKLIPTISSTIVHPNGIAGMALAALPLAASLGLLLHRRDLDHTLHNRGLRPSLAATPLVLRGALPSYKAFCLILAIVWLLILVLANSRGAFVALFASIVVCAIVADRRLWILMPPIAASGYSFIIIFISSPARFLNTANGLSRLEIWQSAWHIIQDFAYTGVGPGAFPHIYPFYVLPSNPGDLTNVHNAYLQTYLDQGLLGFLSWIAILAVVAVIALRITRRVRRGQLAYAMGVGLSGSLAALIVQGIFESSLSIVFRDALGAVHVVASPLPYILAGLAVRADVENCLP